MARRATTGGKAGKARRRSSKSRTRKSLDSAPKLQREFSEQTLELAKLRKQLAESLERQTATSEVLKVIAHSPTDVHSVLQAIAESAAQLCDAYDAVLFLRDGDSLKLGAHHGPIQYDIDRWTIGRGWVTGRSVIDRETLQVEDLATEEAEYPDGYAMSARFGHHTMVATPMLRKGDAIGAIMIRRLEIKPFTDKQIELLETFATQAVIAIENTRLFSELRDRTDDLTESLNQQTATSQVLQVISSSPGELEPVFRSILENATRICEAKFGTLFLHDGAAFRYAADVGAPPEYTALQRARGAFKTERGGQMDNV